MSQRGVGHNELHTTASLHNSFGENSAIDFLFPRHLLSLKFSFSMGLHEKFLLTLKAS